jgi:hypothetical protein
MALKNFAVLFLLAVACLIAALVAFHVWPRDWKVEPAYLIVALVVGSWFLEKVPS